jgi:hypothetical protein
MVGRHGPGMLGQKSTWPLAFGFLYPDTYPYGSVSRQIKWYRGWFSEFWDTSLSGQLV